MTCGYCKKEFEPRKSGKAQQFCPGGKCRRANDTEARRLGVKMLRRRNERPLDFEEARQDPEFQ